MRGKPTSYPFVISEFVIIPRFMICVWVRSKRFSNVNQVLNPARCRDDIVLIFVIESLFSNKCTPFPFFGVGRCYLGWLVIFQSPAVFNAYRSACDGFFTIKKCLNHFRVKDHRFNLHSYSSLSCCYIFHLRDISFNQGLSNGRADGVATSCNLICFT